MKTTGFFAKKYDRTYLRYTAISRHDGELKGFIDDLSTDPALVNMREKIISLFETSFPIAPTTINGGHSQYMFGGYAIQVTGSPVPVPAPVLLRGTDVRVNNAARFRAAPITGDIVVSDYENLRMLLTFTNGGKTLLGENATWGVDIEAVCAVHGIRAVILFNQITLDIGGEFLLSSSHTGYFGKGYILYENEERTDAISAYDDGFKTDKLVEFMNASNDMFDSSLYSEVTAVTAEANTSTLDLLTSLAEMPETVKSIYDGLRFMLRGLKDVKKRNLSLFHKSKKVRTEHEQKVFRLNYNSHREYLAARNERSRRIIQAKKAQQLKQFENDLKRNLDDIASESSSVWLNYRYNIEPTRMMIEDLIDAIFEKDSLYKRWSSRVNADLLAPEIARFKLKGKFDITQRVSIKRRFLYGLPYGHSMSASIFTTAWELIPLSFVYDWIINIGQFIATSSSSTLSKVYAEGSTISLKCDGAVSYLGANDTVVTCELKGYKRVKINPNDYCRLIINPDISGKRQIDALALAWQIFVKRIWK